MPDYTSSTKINQEPKTTGVYALTTDGTQTTIASFTTRSNSAYKVIAKVVGIQTTDYTEVGDYWLEAAFRNTGGTVSAVGSVRSIHTANETTAAWDVTIDSSGTDIRVRATGAAATAITWLSNVEVIEVSKWTAAYGPSK